MTVDDIKRQGLILLEVISGSRSFGLDTTTSDTDIKGVFYMPKDSFYGLEYIPQINNDTNDIVYYELGRFVELLIKNNPNILEILATPSDCIIYKHDLMNQLTSELFLSKLCKDTFAGYAATQIKKARGLKKKVVNPMDKERKSLLSFCSVITGYTTITLERWLSEGKMLQECCGLIKIPHWNNTYALFYDENNSRQYKGIIGKRAANDVTVSSVEKGEPLVAYLHVNRDAYSTYCKEYKEYWDWVEKRNEERYNTTQRHGKNYDSKNMMHTIRLLQSAEQILETGKLNIRVTNRDELLNIKAGNIEYDELILKAENLLLRIEELYTISPLSEMPDKNAAEQILIQIRKQLYR